MAQFTNVPEKDFSLGIDARSSETQIAPGFVHDLLNADVIENRVRKRTGYQGYSGQIPVRVTAIEYRNTDNRIYLTLDSSISITETVIDLNAVRSSPVVLYGRSSNITTGGPFTTAGDNAAYYSGFSVPTRRLFLTTASAPDYESIEIPGDEHSILSTDLFFSTVQSTSATDRSYQAVDTHSVSIDESTYDITVEYQNGTGQSFDVYSFYLDRQATTGSSYVATIEHTGGGSEAFTVTAATHGLDNFNILAQLQMDGASAREIVTPESIVIEADGDVVVTINSDTAADYYLILSAAPVANQLNSNIPGGGATTTMQITEVASPWLFSGVYLEATPGGSKYLVKPDSIAYDDQTSIATVSFTNHGAAANAYLYYQYGELRSNRLAVSDSSISVDAVDTRPQITLWGLDHSEIYGANRSGRSGWVNHLDSYRSTGERKLVAGLGGNLFSARSFSDAGEDYLYPQLYPLLSNRINTSSVIGPVFYDSGDTPARSRGYVTSNSSGTGWVRVTAVEYQADTGYTRYTLSVPGMSILDASGTPTSIGSVVSTTTSLEDWLTVEGMSYRRHEGVFRIHAVTAGTDELLVDVDNEANSSEYSSDWDDDGVGGQAGIFTDQIEWTALSTFLPGDVVTFGGVSSSILSSLSAVSVMDGVTELYSLTAGLSVTGERTSYVVPLRTGLPSSTPAVTNVVRGDMLSYDRVDRLLQVTYINADEDRTVSIDGDGVTGTVTLASGTTTHYSIGQRFILTQAGVFTGEHVITDIPSVTQLEFSSELVEESIAGILQGYTIEVDENLTWESDNSDVNMFYAPSRWIPIEAPEDSFDLTPGTYTRYLTANTYGEQSFLRSSMVMDNMYLTNGDDEVYRFDGSNITRAGIPPWQPGLFITTDTSASGKIVTGNRSVAFSAISGALGQLTITAADVESIPVGNQVRLTGSSQLYTVRAYVDDGTAYYLLVDRALDSGVDDSGGTATEIYTRRYYYRLNAVDANNNIIASAVTGYQDHVVELTADAAINHRIVGFPAWSVYDYARLELEIYGTRGRTPAPFYRITTLEIPFDNTTGYIDYTDSFSDIDLIELDPVNVALLGSELGVNWQEPLQAKYITSINNRLVLANIRDYPQLDIQVVASGTVASSTFAGKTLTFRRDNTATGTTTDMVDTVVYEFVNGVTGTVSALVPGTDDFTLTTSVATGAVEGDWIYLTYSTVAATGRDLDYCGWYQIASVDDKDVTINLTGAATAGSYPDRYVIATDPTNIPVLLGTDGNLGMVNGDSFDLFDLMRRMAMAVNSSMRMVDISLTGMEDFTPWLMARGGNDVGRAGRLVVRRPKVEDTTIEVVLPSSLTGFDVFVNNVRRAASASVSTSTRLYPSRLLFSYENYPEIFDAPTVVIDVDSDSAIDANPADGQELTGIIPFFGEAAFGAAQQSSVLVAFKSNSIYLVDLAEKLAGRNPVQRIETEGLGCTAPYSIAATKGGIVFANESGIYCLRRDQTIQYLGKYMERKWTERVNLDQLAIAQGHHYGLGRMYKLSVPLVGEDENSEVYAYNHTGEAEGRLGAWSRYDNHPATGWANLDADAFFSTTRGQVFSLRRSGTESDYRDSSEAIHFRVDTRAMDFGNSGIRKVVDRILINYRVPTTSNGTAVYFSTDTLEEYRDSTQLILTRPTASTGIGDPVAQSVIQIEHSTDRRRGVYFQVRVENTAIDEGLEVVGMDLSVGGLSDRGTRSAARTTE